MKYIYGVLVLVLLNACTYDFDPKQFPTLTEPRIVVNCFISPDQAVAIRLTWSQVDVRVNRFKSVEVADVELYEDGALVLSDRLLDGELISSFTPSIGCKYLLKIMVDGYDIVTGETSIPDPPSAEAVYTASYSGTDTPWQRFYGFKLSEMNPNPECRSVWIKSEYRYQSLDMVPPPTIISAPIYYYPINQNIDRVNSVINGFVAPYSQSNLECEGFLRLPLAFFENTNDLSFTVAAEYQMYTRIFNESTQVYEFCFLHLNRFTTQLISPSDEYDLYFRSLAKQQALVFDPTTPFVDFKVPIQGNIKNGLGAFAGYSSHKIQHNNIPIYQ